MEEKLRDALIGYFELLVEEDQRALEHARWVNSANLNDHTKSRQKVIRLSKRVQKGEKLLVLLRQTEPQTVIVPPPDLTSRHGAINYSSHQNAPEIRIYSPPPDKKAAKYSALATADPYEADLIRIYNEDPGQWRETFRPEGFGAANHKALFKGDEQQADFQLREEGSYELIRGDDRCFVVPGPRLKLQDSFFRSEAVHELFENDFEKGTVWDRILLVRAAIVRRAGPRWAVERTGAIRAAGMPGNGGVACR